MVLCLVVAPTCTGFGYTLHTCTSCANSYKDTETQPRGHSFATTACTRCGSAKADGEVITTEETYTYIYNGDKLSQMNVGNKSLYFAYDASGQPMSILYDTDKTDSTAGTTYYYITNIQGDVIGIADSAGTQVVSYTYDAWGNILDTDGSMEETLGTINPLRYRGYVYDNESGLYYLQSRYYNPEIGRFISADDASMLGANGDFASLNLFAYCGNNPIAREDDGGEFWNIVIGAVVGGAVSGLISIATQAIEKKGFEKINWERVGVAAASGAVSGVFAATGIPVGGQIAINAIIGAGSSVMDTYVDKGDNATTADYITSAITGGALGAAGGWLGGNGTGTKHLSKSAGQFLRKTVNALGDVWDNGFKATGKTILKAGKYYYSQVARQSIQCGKKAIIPIIISNIPNAGYNTWRALK